MPVSYPESVSILRKYSTENIEQQQQGFIGYRFGISRFRKISTETENNNQIQQIKAQNRVLYKCDLKESDRN